MKTRLISMKIWGIVLISIVILGIFCSPGLAVISKSDLISQYKAGQFWEPVTPTPTPTVIPTTVPTTTPTGTGTGTIRVSSLPSGANVYLDGEYKGVTPEPIPSTGSGRYIKGAIKEGMLTLNGIPAGYHQIKLTKEGYGDWSIRLVVVTEGETTSVDAYLIQIPSVWKSQSIPSIEELLGPTGGYFPGSSYSNDLDSYAQNVPSKGKPNIYLYSDRDLVARVRLAPEFAITVSEPVYQPGKGWLADIRNGSLNGNGDFLFYEALGSDFPWQKKEGYVIRAAYREQDMAVMLGQYGFNEKETLEFIEYWSSHLIGDADFVFYPQETDAVNQDMPLYIRPKPDHVMRIWFYAEPLVSAPEPVTHPEKIVREGFYVVEWGVIIDYKYWINHSPAPSEVLV